MTIAKSTLIALAVLLNSTCASAQFNENIPIQPVLRSPAPSQADTLRAYRERQGLPPAEFDRDFTGTIKIVRLNDAGLRAACPHQFPAGHYAIGCAEYYAGSDICTVYILDDMALHALGWDYDIVFRHERAHCLGWRHN
jgi:hypothetical protein